MKKNNIVPILFSVLTFLLVLCLLIPTFLFVAQHAKDSPTSSNTGPSVDVSPSPSPSVGTSDMPIPSAGTPPASAPSKESAIQSTPGQNENTPTPPPSSDPTPTPSTSGGGTVGPDSWLLTKGPDAGDSYLDKVIFLGDSTTYGLLDRAILPGGQQSNQVWFGVSGHTITFKFHETIKVSDRYGAESGMTIVELAKKEQPEILVITLGVTGGVSYNMAEEVFVGLYAKLIDDILNASPNTKIICNTIYPVCRDIRSDYDADINNENIQKTNLWIKNLVKDRFTAGQSVYFLDSYSLLVGEDGYLPANMSNGDGLHLSDSALQKVVEIVRTHKIPD